MALCCPLRRSSYTLIVKSPLFLEAKNSSWSLPSRVTEVTKEALPKDWSGEVDELFLEKTSDLPGVPSSSAGALTGEGGTHSHFAQISRQV